MALDEENLSLNGDKNDSEESIIEDEEDGEDADDSEDSDGNPKKKKFRKRKPKNENRVNDIQIKREATLIQLVKTLGVSKVIIFLNEK